jgi:hypothetical protein
MVRLVRLRRLVEWKVEGEDQAWQGQLGCGRDGYACTCSRLHRHRLSRVVDFKYLYHTTKAAIPGTS